MTIARDEKGNYFVRRSDAEEWAPAKLSEDGKSAFDNGEWKPLPESKAPPQTTARSVAQNVAAGAVEGSTGLLNMATDPFGTVIGPAIARIGGTAYDAGARVFGYPPMSPEQRADLYGLPQPAQPGQPQQPIPPEQQPFATRVVNAVDQAIPGTKVADVQANTPTEQIARKVTGAAVAGGAGGAGPALVSVGGAVTGDVAARNVPDWAQPGAELAGNVVGGTVTSRAVTPVRTVTTPERAAPRRGARRRGRASDGRRANRQQAVAENRADGGPNAGCRRWHCV